MAKLESPSAERNRDPIWQVLDTKVLPIYFPNKDVVSSPFRILETAAGAGVHTCYITRKLLQERKSRPFIWYPADADRAYRDSIAAYLEEAEPSLKDVVQKPMPLTFTADGIAERDNEARQLDPVDLIININMVHISPWEATLGLFKTSGRLLRNGGTLYMYGPYIVGGTCVESNRRFDQYLKATDPRHGLRDLERVIEVAEENGLAFVEKVEMPANNLSVIFRKES